MTVHQRPEKLRRTYLERTTRCVRLAQLEHEAGVSGPEARVGSCFHSIAAAVGLATTARGEMRPRPTDADVIAKRFLGSAEYVHFTRAMYDDVLALVNGWAPRAEFHPDERFEAHYETAFAGETVTGTIDRLLIAGDRAVIKDYKSGRGNPADPPTVQGDFYSWQVFMHHPQVEVVEYEEEWIRFHIPTDPFEYWREHTVQPLEDWLRSRIGALRDAYRQEHLPVQPGGWCFHCLAPTSCPLPEWVREESVVRDREDVAGQFEAMLVEEARVQHRRKVIRAAVEASGERAFELHGQEYGYAKNPGSSLDAKAAKAAGVDLGRFRKPTPPSFGRRKSA